MQRLPQPFISSTKRREDKRKKGRTKFMRGNQPSMPESLFALSHNAKEGGKKGGKGGSAASNFCLIQNLRTKGKKKKKRKEKARNRLGAYTFHSKPWRLESIMAKGGRGGERSKLTRDQILSFRHRERRKRGVDFLNKHQ